MSNTTGAEHGDLLRSPTFVAFAVAAFLSGANLRLFDALLPGVAADFGVAVATAAVIVTSFTFAYGLFQIVHGPLGDRIGKVRMAAIATICASLASLGSAIAPTLESLAILRFLTGMGVSAVIPLALAWIGDNSAYERRQLALGRFVGFLLLGQVLGPAIGGVLSDIFSWREVLYGLAAAFLVSGIALALGSRSQKHAQSSFRTNAFATYVQLLRNRWVRTVLIAVFLEGVLFFGSLAYIGAFLQHQFGLSFAVTGILVAFYGVGGLLYSLSVRYLLSRLNERQFVGVAGSLLMLCFLALAWNPVWQASAIILVSMGFGLYMLHNTLQTKATEMAPGARGTAIAVFAFSLFVGQAAGITLAGQAIRGVGYSWSLSVIGFLLLLLARWFGARVTVETR